MLFYVFFYFKTRLKQKGKPHNLRNCKVFRVVHHQGQICFADLPARPPKLFELRYRSSHHSPIQQSTGLLHLTVRALSGFESLLIMGAPNKKAPTKVDAFLFGAPSGTRTRDTLIKSIIDMYLHGIFKYQITLNKRL